jgi:hypothetical protein
MKNRHFQLALLIVVYVLAVRGIYAVLPVLSSGDGYLLVPRFVWVVPETWVPYAVGAAVVVGLVLRWGWAWWLSVAALVCELVLFVPRAIFWAGVSAFTLATWIKVAWLLAIAWLLFRTRRLGGIGTAGESSAKAI